MPPAVGTPYFTGCFVSGSGKIDVYLTITGGAIFHPNGWPVVGNVTPEAVGARIWLNGIYLGAQGAMSAAVGHPVTYFDSIGRLSYDLVTWFTSGGVYPNRLLLWPPPCETALLLPVSIGGLSSCTFGSFGPQANTEGCFGGGSILVSPFTISFTFASLLRGDVGVAYGNASGAQGFGFYPSAIGYRDAVVTAMTASGLPPGLSVSGGRAIVGTPTTLGVYGVTLRATDSAGYYHEQLFYMRVGPSAVDLDLPVVPPLDGGGGDPEGIGFALAVPVFELPVGSGVLLPSLHVPDQTTDGGWGINRVDVKVRKEETA